MGITSSLVTALSGLSASQSQIDVVGNNIANVNTTGYKSTAIDFKTQLLENISLGSAPNGNLGGTNPIQIGLGTTAGAVTTNFTNGSLQATGVPTNLAIQGDGFFVLNQGTQQVYTRDGSFQLNNAEQLVSSTGQLVQGYGVDANFNIVPNTLQTVTIPIQSLRAAQATSNVNMIGLLNSTGSVPTAVSHLTLPPIYLSDGAGGVDPTNPPAGATTLSNLTDSSGNLLFQVGDIITLNATKGTASNTSGNSTIDFGSGIRSLAPETLAVTSNTTLSDLQNFLTGGLGINTNTGVNSPVATLPGVTIPTDATNTNAVDLTIDGNPGYDNDITIPATGLSITRGSSTLTPFQFIKPTSANGASVAADNIKVYDSLGTEIHLNIVATLTSQTSSGSTWTYYADSPGGSATGANLNTAVGTGTLTFDTSGKLVSSTNPNIQIDRANTGANPILGFSLNFSGLSSLAEAAGQAGELRSSSQDGAALGVLNSYNIGSNGIIEGQFSNGLTRTVGQVALATFQNNEGLVNEGNNTYTTGPNSGTAVIGAPGSLNAGTLTAGSLELSNVDLSGEFVKLISASTAFSASSRIISSSNQLLQDLLSAVH